MLDYISGVCKMLKVTSSNGSNHYKDDDGKTVIVSLQTLKLSDDTDDSIRVSVTQFNGPADIKWSKAITMRDLIEYVHKHGE